MVLIFDSYQVSDFGSYLHCGEELASRERAEWAFCEGLYLKRALFYTFPIVFLFGKSLMAVELVNVALLSVTAWIFFLIGRRIFGARVATLGLLFFVSNPELWYSVTLASHDIPGVFWLAIFFALFILLRRSLLDPDASLLRLLSLSLGLGLPIFFLDFSRNWHESALVSLAIERTRHWPERMATSAFPRTPLPRRRTRPRRRSGASTEASRRNSGAPSPSLTRCCSCS